LALEAIGLVFNVLAIENFGLGAFKNVTVTFVEELAKLEESSILHTLN
jgi:hypothetical protein